MSHTGLHLLRGLITLPQSWWYPNTIQAQPFKRDNHHIYRHREPSCIRNQLQKKAEGFTHSHTVLLANTPHINCSLCIHNRAVFSRTVYQSLFKFEKWHHCGEINSLLRQKIFVSVCYCGVYYDITSTHIPPHRFIVHNCDRCVYYLTNIQYSTKIFFLLVEHERIHLD